MNKVYMSQRFIDRTSLIRDSKIAPLTVAVGERVEAIVVPRRQVVELLQAAHAQHAESAVLGYAGEGATAARAAALVVVCLAVVQRQKKLNAVHKKTSSVGIKSTQIQKINNGSVICYGKFCIKLDISDRCGISKGYKLTFEGSAMMSVGTSPGSV